MSTENQLPLPVENTIPEPQPLPLTEGMTPEQDVAIDKYVDEGFNYHQAKIMAGVTVMERTATVVPPVKTDEPASNSRGRRSTGRGPVTPRTRPLSKRSQLFAQHESRDDWNLK
jgi:hypothetical protein